MVLAINGIVTMPMMSAPPTSRCVPLAALKAHALNIDVGSSGSATALCRTTKRATDPPDSARYPHISASGAPILARPRVNEARPSAISPPPT